MTCIATDGRSMAADSRSHRENLIVSDSEAKLHALRDGRLVGFAGAVVAAKRYIRWLDEGGDKPVIEDDFDALVLYPDGRAEIHFPKGEPDGVDLPAALGSGAALALGAMLAGASPRRAVAIAAKRDPFTGGAIVELILAAKPETR